MRCEGKEKQNIARWQQGLDLRSSSSLSFGLSNSMSHLILRLNYFVHIRVTLVV